MLPLKRLIFLLHLNLLLPPTNAQLTGPVGATTPLTQKTKECNILTLNPSFNPLTDDISLPITSTFKTCVQNHPGSRLIVPAGNYTLKSSIILSNATNWAFQLDGLITAVYYPNNTDASYTVPYVVPRERILEGFAGVQKLNRNVRVEMSNSTINGEGDGEFLQNFIVIINAVDFEFYSSNGLGAIQGQGYLYRISGNTNRPRMLRLISPINATVHDLLLIDSPKFHFIFDFGENIEVYHLTIRGANLGSYDGIDAIGTNYWVHDNEHARNISVLGGNEIVFIKTYPGGSGYVSNILWENFRSKSSLYGINLNQYWQQTYLPDSGAVTLSNITFRNFSGSIQDAAKRPALYLLASDYIPATDITVEDVTVWTESGSTSVNHISNIFGVGDDVYGPNNGIVELAQGENPKSETYTSTYTITSAPTGWATPTWPAWAVATTGYGTTDPIPVYTPAPLWRPQGDYDKHYWGSF
ncbi:hypothetical protein SS1G_06235 [Sclerotinia sclerotiorum 1980 UF-70]|uniref:Pectate lyase superfamily protein domain-containing protein n=1 Tax=Sclerotinia sclerotiorum (strain ATCC 18683 / 1980 / Ss-1) TaxID=665079 RepID=A7ELN8_SCLS1|nr:hypothetical protein SS1G_06235 [Sclerotinia sclerotiorum 1980 UF-70]EDO03754.1 hypothetical protein SS1G_06235 [Sclerotinia sclerotiorum 1980 UF-70]